MRRRAIIARSIAALVPALAGASLSLWIPLLIFRPAPLADPDPVRWGLAKTRAVAFPAADGTRLVGWWQPAAEPGSLTLPVLHGRSANVSTRAGAMRRLTGDGFGALMVDWRGYGASAGRPSEAGAHGGFARRL